MAANEQQYLALIIRKIEVCKLYKPKFGRGQSITLEQFKALYGADRFYSWFGLDHPLMYAAHKAAGGITSLYRQIGIGCEAVFRRIFQDSFALNETQANWSYIIPTVGKKGTRKLSLDARLELSDLKEKARERIRKWMQQAAVQTQMTPEIASVLKGAVFEVRQGYKSKDSKRQNADIGNAGTALSQGYLPVVAVLSTQIDRDIAERYQASGWLLLTGSDEGTAVSSIYAFFREIVEYDLAAFFERNKATLKATVDAVLTALLSPETPPPAPPDAELELESAEPNDETES